jgi:hypothetical protein
MILESKAVRFSFALMVLLALFAWFRTPQVAQAQVELTPGMLFGPMSVGPGEHLELCFSYLSEGPLTSVIHFRNLTTTEKSPNQTITVQSGGGACASYYGQGVIVGLARGDGQAADWVSPTNALISSMSVVGNSGKTSAVLLGVPKIWVKGL